MSLKRAGAWLNKFNRAKLILIILLAGFTVYQAAQLWEINHRRVFAEVAGLLASPQPPDYVNPLLTRPMRVLFGHGGGDFWVRYACLYENRLVGVTPIDFDDEAFAFADAVVAELFARGVFVERTEINAAEIYTAPVMILDFAFPVPVAVFAAAHGQSGVGVLAEVEDFFTLVIRLGETHHVFFLNNTHSWEFTINPENLNISVEIPTMPQWYQIFASADIAADEAAMALAGAHAAGIGITVPPRQHFLELPGNAFIAPISRHFIHWPVRPNNPYANDFGELHLAFIRNRVEVFFDNPATINQETVGADGIYTFFSTTAVVRYFPWNVLEYNNFRHPANRQITPNIFADFSTALDFVNADAHVVNNFYLAGFQEIRGGHVFWFNYIVGDFPLAMPGGWPDRDGSALEIANLWDINLGSAGRTEQLLRPIEVTVTYRQVARYRKLAFNFEIVDNLLTAVPSHGTDLLLALTAPARAATLAFRVQDVFRTQDEVMALDWFYFPISVQSAPIVSD